MWKNTHHVLKNADGPPSLRQLREAREELSDLILHRRNEAEFQSLFSRCPYVLSEALPLRLSPTEIRPLARPGRSEPDFIIVPKSGRGLESVGVIELKRPSTSLLTTPRKGIALLSRDVATAVAQGRHYCRQLRAELALSLSQTLVISNSDYVFVIAGLTDEVTRKLNSLALYDDLRAQLPGGCQVIPYDELLRRFDDTLPPRTFMLVPQRRSTLDELQEILSQASKYAEVRTTINDDNMGFWSTLEDRWRAGNYIGTGFRRIIDRPFWCVSGTDHLATESPAQLEFPMYVKQFLEALEVSFNCHDLLQQIQVERASMSRLQELLTKRQLQILDEAIRECRLRRWSSTFLMSDNPLNDPDVQILERLGLLQLSTVESGDAWYNIDEVLLELWPRDTN